MGQLAVVALITCTMAWLSHMFSTYNPVEEKYIKKDFVIYGIMVAYLIIFAGMRTYYNDTWVYLGEYSVTPKLPELFETGVDWTLAKSPFFTILMSLFQTLGFSGQTFILMFSLMTLSIYFWFIRKYTSDIFLSVFLAITLGVYTFTLAAIKQTFAIAILTFAVEKCVQKKYWSFIAIVIIASLFHPYAFVFLICPFLTFQPWSKKTLALLFGAVIISLSMNYLFGGITEFISAIGGEYTEEQISGDGLNPLRFIICSVPIGLSFLVRRKIDTQCSRENSLFVNLSMMNGVIMFVAMFGTANLFGRLANYFILFPVLTIPWLIKFVDKRYRVIMILGFIFVYSIYFYYDNTISGMKPFKEEFQRMHFWDYVFND